MKLIQSKVEILDKIDGKEIISRLATVARTCYKSEDRSSEEADLRLVKNLIQSGHHAMIEFYDITVKVTCDRAVAQEWTRHRVANYSMESQRYCNYSKSKFGNEITFILPSWLEGGTDFLNSESCSYQFVRGLEYAEARYFELLNLGWKPQQARVVLPNCTKTELNCKMNLREWRHFLSLRCSAAAHPDIRKLALDLLERFHEQIPIIFDDLYESYIQQDSDTELPRISTETSANA